ncbi:MAG: 5-methyltetrahydropteroyltriglutamate--homocysteine S-methyltransferase [Rhodospirillales bacterium]|nr:5-methyltetrahydropteroyltriglutamate--homocysteine S-methyltransferase [Rhodospirillales bacterium]MCB9997184.1 5-methyltetrahydropteroyltriglutamate--homocysteine S-methyltransferase [Rhodospirillales bacterium]
MVLALNLGFPRVGAARELKKATESYWKGNLSKDDLLKTGKEIRLRHWQMQKDAGISHIPVNDFSFYDQMLDMSCLLGAVPERYDWDGEMVDLDTFFAMARGNDKTIAMEMTKWFDTNYHYIVPELDKGQMFTLSSMKIFEEVMEARDAGLSAVPVLIGPVTYLSLAKSRDENFDPVSLIESLIPVYAEIFNRLKGYECGWVQMDEPYLAMDLSDAQKKAYEIAYEELARAVPDMNIFMTTYFEGLRDNLDLAFSLPVTALHVDLVRAPEQLDACLAKAKETGKHLTLGLVDGRNIWKNDLSASMAMIEKAKAALGEDMVSVAGSCSLLHSPIDLDLETAMDPQIKSWLAFAKQKLSEIATLAKGGAEGRDAISAELAASDKVAEDRKTSSRIHNPKVKERMAAITADMINRKNSFDVRQNAQRDKYHLPAFPTTSIGSFPQTQEIRKARAAFKKGDLDAASYETAMKKEIEHVVKYQEDIGMDVLVHGEPERNDMVEYFGEQLDGFTFSKNGWVQSYGSRCVKPPIIFGDVSRPEPMTVKWSSYAQSLTDKPMKGMLTGPITILCWSFERNDQSREETCKQIALALRDEVADLEQAGITIIQMDEPAIREGLPLRRADWDAYLKWAVDSFKLSVCTVEDSTQIHTHMCYSEFNDIIDSVGALDADVISIETSRSQMELLDAFVAYKYPNEIGPGVYDIHSPRIPNKQEMVDLMEKASKVIDPDLLWVNPDCGLKTRGWAEVEPALKHMVDAAKAMREKMKASKAA